MTNLYFKIQFEKSTELYLGSKVYIYNDTIYRLKNQPNKLVKIVPTNNRYAQKIIKLLKNFKKIKNPAVVRIYQIGSFGSKNNSYYCYGKTI